MNTPGLLASGGPGFDLSPGLAQGNGPRSPPAKTRVLPESITTALANGDVNRAQVLEGSNRNEYRLFVVLASDLGQGYPLRADHCEAATLDVSPTAAHAARARTRCRTTLALAAVGTDAIVACNALAEESQLAGHLRTWAYSSTIRTHRSTCSCR